MSTENMEKTEYGADQIQILECLLTEASSRLRPKGCAAGS